MGDFKIQGITPAAEKLKLGSLNVSKIYNGSTQVWPSTPGAVKYGFMYNWYAANDSRNIANTGWSVPTISNQKTLSDFLGGNNVAGGKLKETGFVHWDSPNTGATNTSNFNARGGGERSDSTGLFTAIKQAAAYWAQGSNAAGGYVSTLSNVTSLYTAYNGSSFHSKDEKFGIGVRLIKDTTSLTNGQTGTYTGNDGKVYRTICVGTQEWVADNLVETKYRNLDAIPEVIPNATWTALSTGARCSYNNDPGNANPTCTGFAFTSKAQLQTAVNLWISNESSAITTYGQINTWCTGTITDMSELFEYKQTFNDDISNWDVSSVTNMERMFYDARTFNQNIGSWDVSNVTNMYYMFGGASVFNGDIDSWDVSSVTNMALMFYGTDAFNQPIGVWDVSSVTLMQGMFKFDLSTVPVFNQPLNNWDVSGVTNMSNMFNGNDTFNQPINSWDVSSVTNMSTMFWYNSGFNQNIGSWDVSSVTNMQWMFREATAFNNGGVTGIGSWNVSGVIDMSYMFEGATSFNQDIGAWDVSSVLNRNNMRYMFNRATIFNQDLTGWCVTLVTPEPIDFSASSALTSANKPVWGTCPP
jgi:uncharacterized protein (TIGR02145 family)